jgi:hypothetical protein
MCDGKMTLTFNYRSTWVTETGSSYRGGNNVPVAEMGALVVTSDDQYLYAGGFLDGRNFMDGATPKLTNVTINGFGPFPMLAGYCCSFQNRGTGMIIMRMRTSDGQSCLERDGSASL